MTLILYIVTVGIWGSVWIAIKLQQGDIAAEVSIIYRFLLAGSVLFPLLVLSRRLQALSFQDHLLCMIQGVCLFGLNFYCFYLSTTYISSGLASVVFSIATVMNMLNNRLWFGILPTRQMLTGAIIGLCGISMLFWPELQYDAQQDTISGILLCLAGTWLFSSGNMISVHHQKKGLRPPTTNAWSILYGTLILTLLALIQDSQFNMSTDPVYLWSLIYLAIPGTLIGFTAYLMLVGRTGADKAAYSTVMFPAIALGISTIFENYEWNEINITGFCLVIMGNLVIFYKRTSVSIK
ncbi:DMT family transporter [Oceanospirillum sp. D5]|uniref:DMT family transporter n=1 Tax=Oceanospirillum sediminis TaxID=2760088 RepID=A0A839IV87_9GAMM|nr:DMT family transporter [Oceanospirillum sediminis]